MCFLCDFESLKNFKLKERLISMDYKVCENIVDNTFDGFYYLNEFIYKYLNTANFLSYCIVTDDLANFGILNLQGNKFDFLNINNNLSIQQCKYAKTHGLNIMANCFSYCSKYNFWYYGEPIFRDIYKLEKIFNNLNEKIFRDKVDFKIEKPNNINYFLPIFELKNSKFNIFDVFQYIFKEN